MSRVLIVDDDPDILLVAEAALQLGGHEAVISGNSSIALDLLDSGRFDCVILDLVMPKLSGHDLLRQIRERRIHADLPVLVLSAAQESSARLQSFRLGAADYLAKPFEPEELIHRVERLVAARRPQQAAIEGDIASYSLPDFAQTLEQSGRTGIVEIETPAGPARLAVSAGRPVDASWSSLAGEQAVFGLFGLEEGTFRFHEAEVGPSGELPAMTSLLMRYHWFLDERRRLEPHLPEERRRLEVASRARDLVAGETRADTLPWETVLAAVEEGAISLRKLRRAASLAPVVVDATVAWLLAVRALVAPGGDEPPTKEIVPTHRADLTIGLRKLQIAAGRSEGDLHVLLAAAPEAWASLVEHLGREPALADQVAASQRRFDLRGAASLEFSLGRGRACFHVVDLETTHPDQLAMALSVSSGAVLWAAADAGEGARTLLARAAGFPQVAGLVVAAAGALLPDLHELAGRASWRVVSTAPRDFSTTLGLLQ